MNETIRRGGLPVYLQAAAARDALAKALYGAVFGWVVERVNTRLRGGGES